MNEKMHFKKSNVSAHPCKKTHINKSAFVIGDCQKTYPLHLMAVFKSLLMYITIMFLANYLYDYIPIQKNESDNEDNSN